MSGSCKPNAYPSAAVLSLKLAWLWTTAEQIKWMKEASVAVWSLNRVRPSRAPGAVRGSEINPQPHGEPLDTWRCDPAVSGSQVTFPKHAENKCNRRTFRCADEDRRLIYSSIDGERIRFKDQSQIKCDVYARFPALALKKNGKKLKFYLLRERADNLQQQ